MKWVELLNLPNKCIVQRKIPLKKLYEQSTLIQKKLIEKYVSSITLVALINEENSRIREYVDEKENYQAIFILEIVPKLIPVTNDLYLLIHSLFPYPTIIGYESDDKIQLTCSIKRINLVNSDKTTVEKIHISPEIRKSKQFEMFTRQLDYREIRVSNIKEYYTLYSKLIQLSQVIPEFNLYPSLTVSTDKVLNLLDQVRLLDVDLANLESQYKHESNLSRKMDIHMKIQNKNKSLELIKKELMEDLCQS